MLAFVGAAPVVRIDWTPKAEGATGLAAMASVQAEQQVWISEGVARTRTTLDYSISRAELGQLTIDVPADQKVVNVFDANVRQWSVETVEGRQRITAQLFEPAKSAQQVTVELEKFTGDKASETIEVPVVKAVGVGNKRQQGVVVVQMAEGLRAEAAKTSGLLQVDAGELPPALAAGKWAFSYRYATADYRVGLEHREGAAADRRRLAGRSLIWSPSGCRLRPGGDLHDREGGRVPSGTRRPGRLRSAAGPRRGGGRAQRPSRSMRIISKAKRRRVWS